MNSMKFSLMAALVIAFVLVPLVAVAGDEPEEEWVQFESVQFSIDGDQPLVALEEAIQDLPKLSRAFQPDGADISDLRVRSRGPNGVPRVAFQASRGLGFIRKSATVRADINTEFDARACQQSADGAGYRIEVDTDASDHLVAANVSSFVVVLCVQSGHRQGALEVMALGRMRKGYDYGRFAGPAIRDLIEAQTDPLINALIDVVRFYQSSTT